MATEKKVGDQEKVAMDRLETSGVRVAEEMEPGQNVSERVDEVAAQIRTMQEQHVSELRKVMGAIDSVLSRLDQQATRMNTLQGRVDALVARENEAARAVIAAVETMKKEGVQHAEKHLDDMRMALRVVESVAQRQTTINVNTND